MKSESPQSKIHNEPPKTVPIKQSPSVKPAKNVSSPFAKTPKKSGDNVSSVNSSKILGKALETFSIEQDLINNDECNRIANEMIYIVYEKLEKVKSQIKAQQEIKRKLEKRKNEAEESLYNTQELIKKLERELEKIELECEQIAIDCEKFDKQIIENINNSTAKNQASEQSILGIIRLIDDAKDRIEKEKNEIFINRDKEITIETELTAEKEDWDLKIRDIEKEMENLEKSAKSAHAKEEVRLRKIKNTTKSLNIAINK